MPFGGRADELTFLAGAGVPDWLSWTLYPQVRSGRAAEALQRVALAALAGEEEEEVDFNTFLPHGEELPASTYTPAYTEALKVAQGGVPGFYKAQREGGNLVPIDAATIATIMGQAPDFMADVARGRSATGVPPPRIMGTRSAPISGGAPAAGGPAPIAPAGPLSGNPPIDAANRVLAGQPLRGEYDFTNARPMGARGGNIDPRTGLPTGPSPGAYAGNVAPTPGATGSYSMVNEPPPDQTMDYVSSLYNMGPMFETARAAGYPRTMAYDTAAGQSLANVDPRTGKIINTQVLPGAIQRSQGGYGRGYVEEAMQAAGIPLGTPREVWTPNQIALFNRYLSMMAMRAGTGSSFYGQGGMPPPGGVLTPEQQDQLNSVMGTS